MLIFDDNNAPILIDSIHTPLTTSHMWVLDLNILDFTLAPILAIEEISWPSIQIVIRGFEFILPATWNILVCDHETSQLDVVELKDVAGKEFTALVHGPRKATPISSSITVTNYYSEHKNIAPSLNKHQMLCHPIGPDEWINVASSDVYNKYLKDLIVGDLIG